MSSGSQAPSFQMVCSDWFLKGTAAPNTTPSTPASAARLLEARLSLTLISAHGKHLSGSCPMLNSRTLRLFHSHLCRNPTQPSVLLLLSHTGHGINSNAHYLSRLSDPSNPPEFSTEFFVPCDLAKEDDTELLLQESLPLNSLLTLPHSCPSPTPLGWENLLLQIMYSSISLLPCT